MTFLQNLKNNGLSHHEMEVWLNLQKQSKNFQAWHPKEDLSDDGFSETQHLQNMQST